MRNCVIVITYIVKYVKIHPKKGKNLINKFWSQENKFFQYDKEISIDNIYPSIKFNQVSIKSLSKNPSFILYN